MWPLRACSPALHAHLNDSGYGLSGGVLLYGPSNSGKSGVVASLALELKAHTLCITAQGLSKDFGGDLRGGVFDAFSRAMQGVNIEQSSRLLCFDGLDILFPAGSLGEEEEAGGTLGALRMFALCCSQLRAAIATMGAGTPPSVYLVGTCRALHAVHPMVRAQFLVHEAVGPPSPPLRGTMLLAALQAHAPHHATQGLEEGIKHLGDTLGFGFMAGDFASVARRVGQALQLPGHPFALETLAAALTKHTPLLLLTGGKGGNVGSIGGGGSGGGDARHAVGAGVQQGRLLKEALAQCHLFLGSAILDVRDHRPPSVLNTFNDGGLLRQSGGALGGYSPPSAGEGTPSSILSGSSAAPALSGLASSLRPTTATVTWEDVKGQSEAKRALKLLIKNARTGLQQQQQQQQIMEGVASRPLPLPPLPRPTGILLHGPPGTGKTLLAKASATELGARFISLSIPSILKAGLGDSESALTSAFALAGHASPSLIFIDEIQALFTSRGGGVGGGQDDDDTQKLAGNLTATLLHCMDTLPPGVLVLAATNLPSALDPALLRPGRLDRLVLVGLPTPLDRRHMFQSHLDALGGLGHVSGPPTDKGVEGEEVDLLTYLVESTEGFSGAECASVCRRAVAVAMGGSGALEDTLKEVYGGGEGKSPFLTPSTLPPSPPSTPQLNLACFVGAIKGDVRSGIMPLMAK